jgi:hypothetical protein
MDEHTSNCSAYCISVVHHIHQHSRVGRRNVIVLLQMHVAGLTPVPGMFRQSHTGNGSGHHPGAVFSGPGTGPGVGGHSGSGSAGQPGGTAGANWTRTMQAAADLAEMTTAAMPSV